MCSRGEVDHKPIRPAFGYRIDYAGRSVVLSGDTRISENSIRHAQDVDVPIHEVVVPETFQRVGASPDRAKRVIEHHVTPKQAGEVFTRTKTYSGALEVGEDLMVIEIGDTVQIRRPSRSSP